jgi:hypothetical protein
MNRMKSLLAVLAVAAIVAVVPAGAQTIHVAGAGSSAQFTSAAIGADTLAINNGAAIPGTCTGSEPTVYHWSFKNGADVVDARSSNINVEPGNVWIVWVGQCGAPGSGVTDIWLDVSVDSTVGVRTVLAQETTGAGAQIGIVTPPGAGANLISSTAGLWPDNSLDQSVLPSAVYNTIGTGITNATVGSDVHVNVGLTDIRPEDALFATTRSINKYTATLSGLGYRLIASNANYGVSIQSGQTGSTMIATPENFSLGGGSDPITGETVPATVISTLGAAPIVFGYNNNGASSFPTNLVSGVNGLGTTSGPYSLAHLFDGSTACDTTNAAFGSFSGPTANVNPILREPVSGTMNATEYSLFRTTGNTSDSQELGVSKSGTNANLNPLNSTNGACSGGGGYRSRAIGTGEVVGTTGGQGIIGIPNGLGYFFWSFSNSNKFYGSGVTSANYNYLTLDGVDPLGGLVSNAAQPFYHCTATNCEASLWPSNQSYQTLRNGTYGALSIYRWVSYASNTDPEGPAALAQAAQDAIDTTIADYVPFYTTNGGIGGTSDGLSVYHSHFNRIGPVDSCGGTNCVGGKTIDGYNGTATSANGTNGGNTLGVGDRGGDEGGVIEGPFGIDVTYSGTVTTSGTLTKNKGYKVTWTAGQKFIVSTAWEGQSITIDGTSYTIANVKPTATILYVTATPGAQTGVSYSTVESAPLAITPGVLNKHR